MIRNEKGITLSSLMIYVIAIVITISILTGIMTYFNSNVKYIMNSGKYVSEFNKFNMYFIEDVKNNTSIYSISQNNDEIIFADGTIYTFKGEDDKGIYRNKVKICKDIEYCSFTKKIEEVDNVSKVIVSVDIYVNGEDLFQVSTDYVLKYW